MVKLSKWALTASVIAITTATTPVAGAQEAPAFTRKQVVSANPFGLLIDLFNAEYERIVGESSTAGFGGSMYTADGDNYLNADLFYRFYPVGTPLRGWAIGGKIGLTNVPDQGTYFGYGFDANRSWVMGKKDNFYIGIGFGLKRLVGAGDAEFETSYIPTFRIVNIGFLF